MTLLEVVFGISILTIGIFGSMAVVQKALILNTHIKQKLIAYSLNQEGMEIARNIRDTNWVSSLAWDNGLAAGDYLVQYNGGGLITFSDTPLQINSSNLYGYNGQFGYSGGINTSFKRKVTISDKAANNLTVRVVVTWQERGNFYSTSAQEYLYNWR